MNEEMCPQCITRKAYWHYRKKTWHCWKCKKEFPKPFINPNYESPKRKVHDEAIINKQAFSKLVDNIPDLETKAITIFLYLTGCRISEALSIKVKQVEGKKDKIRINQVPVLKRRPDESTGIKPYRTVFITLQEKKYWEVFKEYVKSIKPDDYLFSFVGEKGMMPDNPRKRAWRLVKKHTGYWPHYFRHLRVAHLFRYSTLRDIEIQEYMGWSSPRMLQVYSHLRKEEVVKKLEESSLGEDEE